MHLPQNGATCESDPSTLCGQALLVRQGANLGDAQRVELGEIGTSQIPGWSQSMMRFPPKSAACQYCKQCCGSGCPNEPEPNLGNSRSAGCHSQAQLPGESLVTSCGLITQMSKPARQHQHEELLVIALMWRLAMQSSSSPTTLQAFEGFPRLASGFCG